MGWKRRRHTLASTLATAAAIVVASALTSHPTKAQSELPAETAPRIYHKGRNFRIPFNLSPEGKDRVKEVHLLVSDDLGQHWAARSKTYPDHPTFTFRSPRDGEYWFAVQTITRDGRVSPRQDETVEPNLKVVVDTFPPTVLLESAGRRGSVAGVRWEVRDENLDLKTLAIEYQVEGAGVWRRVPMRAPRASGSVSWDAGTADALKVRGSVADRAGNVAQSVVDLSEGTAAPPTANRSDLEFASAPSVDEFSSTDAPKISAAPDFAPVGGDLEQPAAEAPARPRPRAREKVARTAGPAPARARENPAPTRQPGHDPDADLFAAEMGVGAVNSAAAANWDAARPKSIPPGQTPAPPRTQDGPRETLLVGNPRFALQYAVDDAGPEGPASVELWITRDGGRTWIRRGEDQDHVSPIAIDLGGEGTFGISLVARSASGVGDQPPAPNDPPQTWVEVDASPPVVMMRPPQVGTGLNAGKVALAWSASDLHLSPRSTSIFWKAEKPGSDWQLVVAGLENEGKYIWNVPPSVPDRFHVRIEASDTVGHRGGSDTTESGPLQLDRSRPRSRIIGLDPASRVGSNPTDHTLR